MTTLANAVPDTDPAVDRYRWAEPTTEEVTAGVYRIPLPMPGDVLRAVNVYVIEQPGGLTLIDGGWARAEARERLEEGLRAIGAGPRAVTRILVTHAHRDHYTLAVMLRREFGMPIALGAGERDSIEALISPDRSRSSESQIRLMRGAGAPELAAMLANRVDDVDPVTDGWELPDEWLDAGTVAVGNRRLTVVPTPGHTRGHLVFADLDEGLLFAGDHVLPHVTPSIGLETVASPLPLASYLESLSLVRTLPDLRLLPAHGPVSASSHRRVTELLDHHDFRLAEIAGVVASGEQTAVQVASGLGWTRHQRSIDELDQFHTMLAVGETIAHLEVLIRTQVLTSRTDDGVILYSRSPGDAVPPAPGPSRLASEGIPS